MVAITRYPCECGIIYDSSYFSLMTEVEFCFATPFPPSRSVPLVRVPCLLSKDHLNGLIFPSLYSDLLSIDTVVYTPPHPLSPHACSVMYDLKYFLPHFGFCITRCP